MSDLTATTAADQAPEATTNRPLGLDAIALGLARLQRDTALSDPVTTTIYGGDELVVCVAPEDLRAWAHALGLPAPGYADVLVDDDGWRRIEVAGDWDGCRARAYALVPPGDAGVLVGRAIGRYRVVEVAADGAQVDVAAVRP